MHRWRTDYEPAPRHAVAPSRARVGLVGAETVEVRVRVGDPIVGLPVRALGMPGDALLELIVRGGVTIPPRGSTTVEAGDTLLVLVPHATVVSFRGLVGRWRTDFVSTPERRYDARGLPDDVTGPGVAELGLPEAAHVHLVVRGSEAIPPRGGTIVEVGDRLYVLVRHEVAESLRATTAGWGA